MSMSLAAISVTEVNLARVPRALEGKVKGVVRVRGGCGARVVVRGRSRCAAHQRPLIPSFLPVNVLVNLGPLRL